MWEDDADPVLLTRDSIVAGLDFRTTTMPPLPDRSIYASVAVAYCSDSVMQQIREAEITGCGPAHAALIWRRRLSTSTLHEVRRHGANRAMCA